MMDSFVTTFNASGRQLKETCKQCRFRKVRCDGNYGVKGCGVCERLKFDCSFLDTGPASSRHNGPAAGRTEGDSADRPDKEPSRPVERRRTSKACTNCRQQKVRCTGVEPCLACRRRRIPCSYQSGGRRLGLHTGAGSASPQTRDARSHDPTSDSSQVEITTTGQTTPGPYTADPLSPGLPLPPDILALIDFYFSHVYALPSYAFLHPETTERQCADGQLEPCLAYALSAVASLQQGSVRPHRDSEARWIHEAETLIWNHLESPTVPRLQSLLLVVLYRLETGAFRRAFMLSALGTRAAAAIRLNHERPDPPKCPKIRINLEVQRRLMWSLKLVERYFSTGLPEFELCPVEHIDLDLPCWERDFSNGYSEEPPERTLVSCDFGSYHLCVSLEMLRRDIMKLTRSLALCNAPIPQLPTVMGEFEQHLERVRERLPDGAMLAPERILQLLDSPWLPRHILAYLLYHQCQCHLYRLLLRNYREAAPGVVLDAVDTPLLARAEGLCLEHATAIVDILISLNKQSGQSYALEFDTVLCGYHATRLLLFISQFGQKPSRPDEEWALGKAEGCLACLRRFFSISSLARSVLDEMQRIISSSPASRSAAAAGPSRLASPPPASESQRDASASLSAAARVRQRLAIHSLLRQADFTDEDEPKDGTEDAGGSSRSDINDRSPNISTPAASPGVPTDQASLLSAPPQDASIYPEIASPPLASSVDEDQWHPCVFGGSTFIEGFGVSGPRPAGLPSFSFPWLHRQGGDLNSSP